LTHTGGSNDDAGYRSTFLCHSLQHLYEGTQARQNALIYLEDKHWGFARTFWSLKVILKC